MAITQKDIEALKECGHLDELDMVGLTDIEIATLIKAQMSVATVFGQLRDDKLSKLLCRSTRRLIDVMDNIK